MAQNIVSGHVFQTSDMVKQLRAGVLFSVDLDSTATPGNSINLRLLTGSLPTQIEIRVAAAGEAQSVLIEAPTITVPGTPLAVINRNRVSGSSAELSAFSEPTHSGGTIISDELIPIDSVSNLGDFILAPATEYVLEVTHLSGGPNELAIDVQFTELNINQITK